MTLVFVIPGEPVAWGRPRPAYGSRRYINPKATREWEVAARIRFGLEMRRLDQDMFTVPVACHIDAVFECPRSAWLKRAPRPRRVHESRPDGDNLAKAVLDAGNRVVWFDDAKVAELLVRKWIGAQGEAPHVRVEVRPL